MKILTGDAFEMLKTLPDESVHCCVTSPPYYGLRDYGIDGQLGLEASPLLYVERLVNIFRQVKRVLRSDGTLWLNLGDSYASNGKKINSNGQGKSGLMKDGRPEEGRLHSNSVIKTKNMSLPAIQHGVKVKDLLGIPWRVAFALQDDGWYLRQDIIWAKPNPMPESVKDRCTKSHEYIFLLSKSAKYFYDADSVQETFADSRMGNPGGGGNYIKRVTATGFRNDGESLGVGVWNDDGSHSGRNKRDVWSITTKPYSAAHFATFPPELPETCIKAGAPQQVCDQCGSPYEKTIEKGGLIPSGERKDVIPCEGNGQTSCKKPGHAVSFFKRETKTIGVEPSCDCQASRRDAPLLDPLHGAGTTGLVALR